MPGCDPALVAKVAQTAADLRALTRVLGEVRGHQVEFMKWQPTFRNIKKDIEVLVANAKNQITKDLTEGKIFARTESQNVMDRAVALLEEKFNQKIAALEIKHEQKLDAQEQKLAAQEQKIVAYEREKCDHEKKISFLEKKLEIIDQENVQTKATVWKLASNNAPVAPMIAPMTSHADLQASPPPPVQVTGGGGVPISCESTLNHVFKCCAREDHGNGNFQQGCLHHARQA